MEKILIFTKLKSQVNYRDQIALSNDEPFHPYMGIKWSNYLKEFGFEVCYLNEVEDRLFLHKKNPDGFIAKYVRAPREFTTVIVYSTSGLGKALLLRIFNWRLKVVYFHLSEFNPDGGIFKRTLRCIIQKLDMRSSNRIFFGLNALAGYKINLKIGTYYPFFVDINYFQGLLKFNQNKNQIDFRFLLIVGDITRDDYYTYSELSNFNIPVVRVTRDKKVSENAKKLYHPERGDIILSGVSFSELAELYSKSLGCIIASKFDSWQPGGITSLVEALACRGICIANAGGCIESEFRFLSKSHGLGDPVLYYRYPKSGALKSKIEELISFNDEELNKRKSASLSFVKKCLNLNTKGLVFINEKFVHDLRS